MYAHVNYKTNTIERLSEGNEDDTRNLTTEIETLQADIAKLNADNTDKVSEL